MPADLSLHYGRLITASVGRGVADDDRVSLANDHSQNVIAIQRSHGCRDHVRHRSRAPDPANFSRLSIDQGDHGQVVTELMTEPQHQIEGPVDVLGIEPGSENLEERVEQVAHGFQIPGALDDSLLEIGVRACELLGHPGKRKPQNADLIT